MTSISEFHDKAMDFADQAYIARRHGNADLALDLTQKALELEIAATDFVKNDLASEPTRSVLYRSAASLALECGDIRQSEKLIAIALSGNPPVEIAEELRDLLEQVHFARHLRLQNVDLTNGELQLSIVGSVVGHGIALSEVLLERIKDMGRLIYRTVERKLGWEFRERGSVKKNIQDGYSLYIAVPRPGSFAVTLRLGRQMELPGLDLSGEVVDEILDCFELLNNNQDEQLREKIPQTAYYQNFIGLAKRIAPDGDKVNMVGLTKVRNDKEQKVALTRTQQNISYSSVATSQDAPTTRRLVRVTGRLLLADARKSAGKIKLREENEAITEHTIIVPEGMMDDIVKPLWDEVVTVVGIQSDKKIFLHEISKVS